MHIAIPRPPLVAVLAALAMSNGWAQQPPPMDEAQMQAMMEAAEKMQACMAEVGQPAMKVLEERGNAMQAEVKQLCAAGKRDEAQSRAMTYAKEMSTSEEMKAMQKCAEIARAMQKQMPAMAAAEIPAQFDPTENGHICDNLGE